MFQLMLAVTIARRIGGGIPIVGYDMPEWSLRGLKPQSIPGPSIYLRSHKFDMACIIYLYGVGAISSIKILDWGMRVEYFKNIEMYRNLFKVKNNSSIEIRENKILFHIRGEDISSGMHAEYFPVPFLFYEKLIDETGLQPVFMGQLAPDAYTDAIRERFKGARFLPAQSAIDDFSLIRKARNIGLSTSSFSWLAAWFSTCAESIYLPARGLFEPGHPHTNLLPVGDGRYHFYDIGFPALADRKGPRCC